MNNLKNILLILVVLFSTTGCATLFGGGSTEVLNVESSSPIKLKIIGSDGEISVHTTPFNHQIVRSKEYTIKLVSDEYESSDIFLNKTIRGLAFLNLFNPFFWAIDFATGNVWRHEKKYVYIDTKDLERKKAMLENGTSKFEALITVLIKGNDKGQEPGTAQVSKNFVFHRIES